jgi:hypothetical protein
MSYMSDWEIQQVLVGVLKATARGNGPEDAQRDVGVLLADRFGYLTPAEAFEGLGAVTAQLARLVNEYVDAFGARADFDRGLELMGLDAAAAEAASVSEPATKPKKKRDK